MSDLIYLIDIIAADIAALVNGYRPATTREVGYIYRVVHLCARISQVLDIATIAPEMRSYHRNHILRGLSTQRPVSGIHQHLTPLTAACTPGMKLSKPGCWRLTPAKYRT